MRRGALQYFAVCVAVCPPYYFAYRERARGGRKEVHPDASGCVAVFCSMLQQVAVLFLTCCKRVRGE